MAALDSKLRDQLDTVCKTARELAVSYARSSLEKRAVDAAEPLPHFGPKEKDLRNRLRARGRQVGDTRNDDKTQSIDQLTQELAYEYWHRMLFARFLAENNLLMHPDGVAVSLEECEELAPTADPPAANGFVLAARYASLMLPQIFRADDVLLEIELAPEQRLALQKLLASLPKQTFLADDSLGWVYQFWQTAEKEKVNKSGDKIDGHTIPAVTQLFTEQYMVDFLLQNTIGAWWCSTNAKKGIPGGAGTSVGSSPVPMPYLRWREDGSPAASYPGWPSTLAEFTMIDPCCGSGHFLVSAFNLLVPLRMHDEQLSARAASEAVLRENLFGLELDPRCTQIAAFALALAAWKFPDAGGYRPLPRLNIACSGQDVTGKREEWSALYGENSRIQEGITRLFELFGQSPQLGSLIDPRHIMGDMFTAGFHELLPLLERKKQAIRDSGDADSLAVCVAAQDIVIACEFLSRSYQLVATNVPYLARRKHIEALCEFADANCSDAKQNLATIFLDRCIKLCDECGVISIVSPQDWLFLDVYESFRRKLLKETTWNIVTKLGTKAFQTPMWDMNIMLFITTRTGPRPDHSFIGLDVSTAETTSEKSPAILSKVPEAIIQREQFNNPDARVVFGGTSGGSLLKEYATALMGVSVGDSIRFERCFWEVEPLGEKWEFIQGTVSSTVLFGGRSGIIFWEKERGEMYRLAQSVKHLNHAAQNWLRGKPSWGKLGVAVSQMADLPCTLYTGEIYDCNCCAIIPNDVENLPALWAFCRSDIFLNEVRKINQALKVPPHTFLKIPFDLDYWSEVARKEFPDGLPCQHTEDITQWVFAGSVCESNNPLQVGVARLLGYSWPMQAADDALNEFCDSDGIVCLPGVRGEEPASERLLELLRKAYGTKWSDSILHNLLREVGCKPSVSLEDWLRNQFFEQHCKIFCNRPFVWHLWDGRRDGFSTLINYHKFTHKALENLTFSYLGDWITSQSKSDKPGADLRLAAAQLLQEKLKAILAGEAYKNPNEPDQRKREVSQFFDIFVRWKPVHEQAIGWHPDLDDGVRVNIRPFVEAGILRKNPSVNWNKDRGKEPFRDKSDFPWFWKEDEFLGDRLNDLHLTNFEKQMARDRKSEAK
jgi:hypothetical protein